MSEYQYYEFQAIDRPLGEADRNALRALSTRARITATSFTNSYEWGDFKGDPAKLMERWFDLHLYLANWGTRRLMIRLPKRLVDRRILDSFLGKVDCAELRAAGQNVILDIVRDEVEFEDWDDGSSWLAALAPLRAEVLAGDLRLFYLLWLTAVEADALDADEAEPMPGIGPLTPALEAFTEFFGLDPDLVQAATERSAAAMPSATSSGAVQRIISALTDREKTSLLARLFDGDPHVAAELRAEVRDRLAAESGAAPAAARSVGELRARARAIGLARERAMAEKAAAERKRQVRAAEKARRARLDAIARRGEGVWREVEAEIERRNPAGYDKAASLLSDLRALAEEHGTAPDFAQRLRAIRERHASKRRFLERVASIC
ncbi:MAG TPA: hypothetical protein VN980_07325 [Alphaproteobacteria bacterium]|nr:hypothetical protein [Alphaproteobacteria bacterium]